MNIYFIIESKLKTRFPGILQETGANIQNGLNLE